ncbi:MAG: FAD-dependent monooxygenase [Burkholderiaceae bacterium]|nr:FAD-dependent monooxygenase [Rhodoferax sp.]MCP5285170.1 FAD-dependent monooxygenase [Burkholderiaceae bacterium]
MHHPDSSPRQSIYFDYCVRAPSPAVPTDAPVLVVGGGPIGLTTALLLAQQGIRCRLLTADLQVSEGSRAIVFTRRSMEILQQAGVSDTVVEQGLAWRFGNSFYRGQRVFRMEAPFPDEDRFAPMTNLQQQVLEELLIARIAAEPLIELCWGHKLVALHRNDAGGVDVEIDTPHGPYRQPAAWVVAADGARSTLRQLCGLKLEGAAYEGRFVIADIRIDLPLPTERLAFFDPDWNRGNTVLMHREPQGIWRIDYQLPPGEDPADALRPEALKARIDAQLAMIGYAGVPWEMDWSSVYSARALTLPDYVHHRVCFVGDAAHLLPIFGVRGANTGFQDAQNLAWKLGMVVRGLAGPALLASYSHERVAAAREIVDEAGKSTRFMTPPTRGFRLLRDAVLSLSLTQDFVRPLYHWRTSRPHDYGDSPLNSGAGPAGDPLPNLKLGIGLHLLDHVAAGAVVLLTTVQRPDLTAVMDRWQAKGLRCAVLALPALERLGLADGHAWLLRPDQHVAARWTWLDATTLDAAIATLLGGPAAC